MRTNKTLHGEEILKELDREIKIQRIKSILLISSLVVLGMAFVLTLGIVGGLETDATFKSMVVPMVIDVIMLAYSITIMFISNKWKDEDDEEINL